MAQKIGTSPAMVRRVVIFCLAQTVVCGLAFVTLIPGLPGPKWIWSLACVPIQLVSTTWFVLGNITLGRMVHSHDGRVCWDCGYVLAGLEDAGRCPECGRDYEIKQIREKWMISPNRSGPAASQK